MKSSAGLIRQTNGASYKQEEPIMGCDSHLVYAQLSKASADLLCEGRTFVADNRLAAYEFC